MCSIPNRFCRLSSIILALYFCGSLLVPAEAQKVIVRPITVNEGLPQGYVSGIVQDDNGFIWLGTRDGLARYDGKEFKVFRSGDARSTTISTNTITGLYRDPKNRIWILHESGVIDILDPHKEKFLCYTCDPANTNLIRQFIPNFAYVDSRDQVWLISEGQGFLKSDLNTGTLHRLSKKTVHNFLSDTVRAVIETRDKQYWIVSTRGAQLLNEIDEVVTTLLFAPSIVNRASTRLTVLHQIPLGLSYIDDESILIRDWDAAFVLDMKQSKILPLISPKFDSVLPNISTPQKDPAGNNIIEIMGSLFQVMPDRSFKKIKDGTPGFVSFHVDRSGVAWLGNDAKGVQTIDLRSTPFKSFNYTVGFSHDVLIHEKIRINNKSWLNYPPEARYGNDSQLRFDYDTKANLWIINTRQTFFIQPDGKTSIHLPDFPITAPEYDFLPATISNDTCWRLVGGNPVYYNVHQSSWTYPLGKNWKLNMQCRALDIAKHDHTLWTTTAHDGLVAINIKTGHTTWYNRATHPHTLPTNQLTDIEQDPVNDSLLWIGTRSGLVKFNVYNGQSRVFTMQDGLPNNTIYCIVDDAKNFLWLSTNKGLCRFDPRSYTTQNFRGSDGLQGDEFNAFHKMKLPDGRIALGGTEGFTIFDPLQIEPDTFQTPVQLTKLIVNNHEIDTSLASLSSLHLTHDQNFLTFHFTGLQFNNVSKIQYRYRLKDFDQNWNYTGTLSTVNYTNIPPGHYTLELNATNTAGTWSNNIRSLSIIIAPPFWKTGWAYTMYLMVFAGTLIAYIRHTVKKIRLENLVDLKNKETQQLRHLNEIKSRFFTNITHEFRTPLTLIISPMEQLLNNSDIGEFHKKRLQIVQQNARQLLQLINQLLELSKLESGLLKISLTRVNIETFLERLVTPFHSVALHKHLELSFQSTIPDGEYLIDTDKLERIVHNLLSNSIKFTPEGGSITLSATATEQENSIHVITLKFIDTGIGIAHDVIPLIFDRFYQVDDKSNRAYEGTGIGLPLAKELTTLLNGTMIVESTPGRGTTFTVTLPVSVAVTHDPGSTDHKADPMSNPTHMHRNNSIVIEQVQQTGYENKPLVLIVEDNDSLRDFLCHELSAFYSIVTASNGVEAWERVGEELPELIVTDVMMPCMDGISLSRKIRETEATCHIGLIMLTAKSSADRRVEGLQTGANDYISKPFSLDELQLRIANLLTHQKRQREYFYNQLLKNESPRYNEVENDFLKKAYQFFEDALADKREIGVEDLADHMNMSSRTLNRKLSSLLGLSANELIRNYRLSKATLLLKKGMAVSEVAYQVGFDSPQYFSQCFKGLYKVTPTQYIEK